MGAVFFRADRIFRVFSLVSVSRIFGNCATHMQLPTLSIVRTFLPSQRTNTPRDALHRIAYTARLGSHTQSQTKIGQATLTHTRTRTTRGTRLLQAPMATRLELTGRAALSTARRSCVSGP